MDGRLVQLLYLLLFFYFLLHLTSSSSSSRAPSPAPSLPTPLLPSPPPLLLPPRASSSSSSSSFYSSFSSFFFLYRLSLCLSILFLLTTFLPHGIIRIIFLFILFLDLLSLGPPSLLPIPATSHPYVLPLSTCPVSPLPVFLLFPF